MVLAHHQQAFEHALARTGVQRRNHQVPRERRAYGDGRRLFIANLADDERLWVLAQQMPRGPGEIQPARLVHFRLHDTGHDLLHRVFHRDDVSPPQFGEATQTGINRRRLAAARRASEQQQPARLP